jgi:O-succinylhomoserine sulfhydrylase
LYLTSSFVFEDAEDMRASFAEEKDRNIYSRYSNPNTNEFVEKVCKMEGQLLVLLCFWNGAVYSTMAALLNLVTILFLRVVFWATHLVH